MADFALIGAAGYIAPRHFRAIHDNGGKLIAALDKSDSVGAIDHYFPEAAFFTEMERFDRHLEKRRRAGTPIDYLSVCTPNYLHDAHIRFGLRQGTSVICEKPLALNARNLEPLMALEAQTGSRVFTVLQLRLHPAIKALREALAAEDGEHIHEVDLTYITARGLWYYASWKGDPQKSGGIATNIGIHFFDLLIWLFGPVQESRVHLHTHDRAAGYLELQRARVRWFLSIDGDTLPETQRLKGGRAFRSLQVDGREIDFTESGEDLISETYRLILAGNGFGLQDALPSVSLTERIRKTLPSMDDGPRHPMAALPLRRHPFE